MTRIRFSNMDYSLGKERFRAFGIEREWYGLSEWIGIIIPDNSSWDNIAEYLHRLARAILSGEDCIRKNQEQRARFEINASEFPGLFITDMDEAAQAECLAAAESLSTRPVRAVPATAPRQQEPPTIGRIVHYRLTGDDARNIIDLNEKSQGSIPKMGDELPAMIVRALDGNSVNLKVSLDGQAPDYWVTCVPQSLVSPAPYGTWHWPERLPAAEPKQFRSTREPTKEEIAELKKSYGISSDRPPAITDSDPYGNILVWDFACGLWRVRKWNDTDKGIRWQPMPPPPQ